MHRSNLDFATGEAKPGADPGFSMASGKASMAERLLVVASSPRAPGHGGGESVATRALDIALALVLITLLLPVLGLIATAIAIFDPGPTIFAHRRVGRHGRQFDCYKFRTMRVGAESQLERLLAEAPELRAEWATDQKLFRDPRVTGLGRFLRVTCLDELPQLFNVLAGDMSLVGPRPIVASELSRYRRYASSYLSVKPGLTGLWQVSRCRHTTYQRRVATDVLYVKKKSLALDCRILLATIPAVLKGQGSY